MLAGRHDERDVVRRLLDDAVASRGGALVVRGLAGVGKSGLLDDAIDHAAGMRVLRTEGVGRAFLDRCRRLPEAAQALLLVIAADDSGRVRTVRQAASELGAGDEAWDAAERSGLLSIRDGVIELRHRWSAPRS